MTTPVRLIALAAVALSGGAHAYDCSSVPAWTASAVYTGGNLAQLNQQAYQAKWWTQNQSPATHSSEWDVWKPMGACDGGGGGGDDTTPPSVPSGLSAGNVGTDSITLRWNASSDAGSGVAGYDVYRGGSLVASPTGTSHTDTGLRPGTSYSYTVRARDKAGNASAQSPALLTSTASGPCAAPPATPTGLKSPAHTSDSVSLAWNAVAAGANCTVQYRVLQGSSTAAEVATTTAKVGSLRPDTPYTFTVQAFNQKGASQPSSPVTVRTDKVDQTGGKNVLGYFAQWGIYGRGYQVKHIDTSGSAPLLTHINYAFGNVRENKCEVGVTMPSNPDTGVGGDAFADYTKSFGADQSVDGVGDTWDQKLRGNWNQLKKLKAKYPKLKVLISLGGWTYSRGFSSAARPENRVAFVKSCVDAYIKGDLPLVENAGGPGALAGVFDGIDIDWEYPVACGLACGRPEDKENFTALLAEFRKQLDAVRPGLLLTIAAPAGVDKIRVIEPDKFHPYLDFINVMTYDFHGAWETPTNFHSPLYGSSADPSTGDAKSYNTNDALKAFLDKGVPARKLHLGIGFYGRGWTNVPNVNNGLYQTGVAAPGRYEAGIEDYKVLKTLNYPSFVDPQSRAQWIYNGTTFWSFDTPVQIKEKMDYAKSKGLGGAFFWEFTGDDSEASLLKAISNGLR
ncbi:glycosyl hydrolase family 18 protein [Aquabacterium sp. A7-Y]|uniref:glycosyl hydrolase family 18 protein n=1 Tax=Aquabacterium sp. A7-Y TaxID=1349605 RepID=UPI00223DE09B|nr:glycosyl hydrolase family 18 protein [Aquabacterium sp. A7-Y]MCW7540548.1 glycosyl hydrolase family 18 protein [Aquabacterium sp. A7-Y]